MPAGATRNGIGSRDRKFLRLQAEQVRWPQAGQCVSGKSTTVRDPRVNAARSSRRGCGVETSVAVAAA